METDERPEIEYYGYERAKELAAAGVWSVTLPDAPNIAPDDVVVLCVGPRPDSGLWDGHATDAGGTDGQRWITVTAIGTLDGELEVMTASETAFLNNYRWTVSQDDPLPMPDTIAGLVGLVSGTRRRGEDYLPTAAARTIADAMIARSMEGHVKQTLPASRWLSLFANAQLATIAALAIAGWCLAVDAGRFGHLARLASIAAVLVASCGFLVDAAYRRETEAIRRLPEGYGEGRAMVAESIRLSSAITIAMGFVVLVGSSVLS